MLKFWEEKIVNGEAVRIDFQRLTSIRITKKDAEKTAEGQTITEFAFQNCVSIMILANNLILTYYIVGNSLTLHPNN